MGAEGNEAAGDRPDVDIVHGDDAGDFVGFAGELFNVDAGGRAFEQDADRLPQENESARDDERADGEADDNVDRIPAGGEDDDGGDHDTDGAEGVGGDFVHGAAGVEVTFAVGVEQPQHEKVEGETETTDNERHPAFDGVIAANALERFEDDVGGEPEHEQNVDGYGEHFGAGVAVGAAGIGAAAGDGGGREREEQPGRIDEHVARVGDEREGSADDTGNDFDGGECERERQPGGECASKVLVRRGVFGVGHWFHRSRGDRRYVMSGCAPWPGGAWCAEPRAGVWLMATVRYMVDDIVDAVEFYEGLLGFELRERTGQYFAVLSDGDLTLWLSGSGSTARKPLTDGRLPAPGGWNRLVVEVRDLEALVSKLLKAHATFQSEFVTSPGGKQVVVEDPSGNPVELFEPV